MTGQSGLRHSVALAIDPFSSRFNGFPGKMIYEFAGFSHVFHMSFMLLEREHVHLIVSRIAGTLSNRGVTYWFHQDDGGFFDMGARYQPLQ